MIGSFDKYCDDLYRQTRGSVHGCQFFKSSEIAAQGHSSPRLISSVVLSVTPVIRQMFDGSQARGNAGSPHFDDVQAPHKGLHCYMPPNMLQYYVFMIYRDALQGSVHAESLTVAVIVCFDKARIDDGPCP